MSRIKEIENRVRYILESNEDSRSNDWILLCAYYDTYYNSHNMHFLLHMKATPPESVTRARRKIQEGGELKPDIRTRDERIKREMEYHDYANGITRE